MTARRLLLLHPRGLDGEKHGTYIQHIASMQWLLADRWDVVAMDPSHPQLDAVALTSDVVVVHMLATTEIESLIRLRRERGLATLFEISDNFLDLGNWLPQKHTLRNPLVRQQILYHASIADGVQVYSDGLADLFRHVNGNVIALDPYVPLARRTRTEGPFVLGWGGTTSHAEDLARIAPVIVAFCRRHPDAVFSYMGDATLFARLFGAIPAAQTRVRSFGPYEDYLDFLTTLDAGLAPLGATAFNACRTDTKFATYAARGVAAVLEDSDVYRVHADRALMFASAAELDAALESLYGDPSLRVRIADRAYEWAARERSPERLRAQRIAAYERLMPERALAHPPVDAAPEFALTDPAALEAIVAAHPRYDQARLALCRWYEGRGEYDRALALLEGVEVRPLFADAAASLRARLARRMQPGETVPRESFEAMLERQPYDFLALANTIRELLARDPSSPDLPELCLRACLVAPELVPREHRPASLARYLPA